MDFYSRCSAPGGYEPAGFSFIMGFTQTPIFAFSFLNKDFWGIGSDHTWKRHISVA